MISSHRLKISVITVFIVLALLFAGCTQPAGNISTPAGQGTVPATTGVPGTRQVTGEQPAEQAEMAALAAALAHEIDPATLSDAVRDGPGSPAFAAAEAQLNAFKANDSRLVYVYTVLQEKNGTVRFLITANYQATAIAPFMSPYPDAPDELKKPVTTPIGVGPYTDSWGTFVSGFAPVNMSPEDRVVLAGVDIRSVQASGQPGTGGTGLNVTLKGPRPPETSQEVRDYVDNAASWAVKNGKSAALGAFNNASGPFVTGDVYIYALDYSGVALALPFQPSQVGENFIPKKDAAGKPYTAIEIALTRGGGGFILYHYPYPANASSSRMKISYVRPVDETYWIGAGVYTSEDRLVDPELRQFVTEAKAYALANGREKALAAFNNQSGPFIKGDLYIFAYDYNGTVLAWPYRPDQIGVNRFNATDPVGSYHIQEFIRTGKNGSGMVDYYSENPFTNRTDLKISYLADIDGTWMIGAGRYIEPGPVVLRE